MLIKFLSLFASIIFATQSFASQAALELGKEEVKSVEFPKFSVSAMYNIGRKFHGHADPSLRFNFGNELGIILAFEAGLKKYFNAGAQLTFGIPHDFIEPVHLGLELFAKPFLALNKSCAFYSRMGAGISAAQGGMKQWLQSKQQSYISQEISRVYGDRSFYNTAFGLNVHASIGFEYFPWPLFGIALEGGARADFWRERGLVKQDKAPHHFDYMTYEFPLGAVIHIIL